jgi:hypothetical protein
VLYTILAEKFARRKDFFSMERSLRFAEPVAFIEVPLCLKDIDEETPFSEEIRGWADNAAHLLDTLPSGVLFQIGKLRLNHEESRKIAKNIALLVCEALKSRGVPQDAFVEIDRIRQVKVWKHQVRTLLPHTDGAHCSYLTPSLLDDASWNPRFRTFSFDKFSTTEMHKMYQGIFIVNPGEGISVTTYYDWLKVLGKAYSLVSQKKEFPVEEVQQWLGQNIRNALEQQPLHGNRYLSIGAALGAKSLFYQGMVIHAAEEELTAPERERFPALNALERSLAATNARVPVRLHILDMILTDIVGMNWHDFCSAYEVCLPSERFDYVLGHNLGLLHGGLMGGPARQLEPMSIVLRRAGGDGYEAWLAQVWRRAGARYCYD